MSDVIKKISLEVLQKASFSMALPVHIKSEDNIIQCDVLVRMVPGKRLVFAGLLRNGADEQKVIIKLFIHPSKAKKHWQRECRGAKLLHDKNILTPEIIAQGVSEEGVYYLVFPYIEGQNLAQFWHQHSQDHSLYKREQKLKELLVVLEKHHSAGLAHQDVHYANFYLARGITSKTDAVYTLDGEEVKASNEALNKHQRLKNLALFLAQTFDLNQTVACSLLKHYLSISAMAFERSDCNSLWQWIRDFQQQRIDQYLKKMSRECSEIIYQEIINKQKKQGYSLCRREYHSQAIQQLLDQPEQFFQDQQSQYLKQGNTCTVKSVLVANERYVVKRYNPKGKAYELKHMGQISRAKRSWLNAHLLRFMGIRTAEPVALIEQQSPLGESCRYFICKYQTGQTSWDYFCEHALDATETEDIRDQKKRVAERLVAVLYQLGDYGIVHGDLKGSNFLIDNNEVYLLDLDAMNQYKFKWQFSKKWQRDKLRFLKNWDKKACYKPWKDYFSQLINV